MRKLLNEELNRLSIEDFKNSKKIPVVLVLDNIRSLNNVGSAFRTADAFRIEKILLCGITAKPPHREIRKTALGATESVEWQYFKSTLDAVKTLRQEHYKILAVEQADHSTPLNNQRYYKKDKYALIFGNEVKGVMDEIVGMADKVLEIPQFGTKHSLNISVSIGVVLWDYHLKTS